MSGTLNPTKFMIEPIFAVVMLHLQILHEENYLTAVFGDEYLEYRSHVLRYLGRRKDR